MTDSYVTALLDELRGYQQAGALDRAREVLAEVRRVAPDVAKSLDPKAQERAVNDKAPSETR